VARLNFTISFIGAGFDFCNWLIGKTVIIGLPGEPFGRYSVRLRKETIGNALMVAEEGNGYLSYFPTNSENKYGSYEPNAAVCAPGCEDALINGAKRVISSVNPACLCVPTRRQVLSVNIYLDSLKSCPTLNG
jgi:hypothetical protein